MVRNLQRELEDLSAHVRDGQGSRADTDLIQGLESSFHGVISDMFGPGFIQVFLLTFYRPPVYWGKA